MDSRTLRFRLGLFVLGALGLLAILVLTFGSVPAVFRRTEAYSVRFSEAAGVRPGTPVRRAGVRIGEVRDVVLDEERGVVRVRLALTPGHRPRRDEQVVLVTALLGGDVAIDFRPREPEGGEPEDRGPLDPGAELVGLRPANFNTLLAQASDVVPTTQEALNDIRKSLQRLEKLVPVAEDTLKEYQRLARSARDTIPDLRKTNEEYQKLAQDVRQMLPEIRKTNEEVQGLVRQAREALPELRKTNEEIQKLVRSVQEMVPDVRRGIEDAAATARTWGKLGERLDVVVQENREKVSKAIDQLNEVLHRISAVLSEENQRNVAAILKNTRVASDRFDSLTSSLDDVLTQSRTTVRRLNDSLVRLTDTLADLQRVLRPLGTRGESLTRNLDEGLQRLNQTLGDVRALMGVLDRGDSTLRRFLTDPSLYNHLDQAACLVQQMMPRIEYILRNFETFADKLARHPELLGLGGAIRPSRGLKEAPTPSVLPHYPVVPAPGP